MTSDKPDPVKDGAITADDKATEAFFEALAGRDSNPQTGDEKSDQIFGQLLRDAIIEDAKAVKARGDELLNELYKRGVFKGPHA